MSSAAARVGGMESAKHSALSVATKLSASALSYGLAVRGGQPGKVGGSVLHAAVAEPSGANRSAAEMARLILLKETAGK